MFSITFIEIIKIIAIGLSINIINYIISIYVFSKVLSVIKNIEGRTYMLTNEISINNPNKIKEIIDIVNANNHILGINNETIVKTNNLLTNFAKNTYIKDNENSQINIVNSENLYDKLNFIEHKNDNLDDKLISLNDKNEDIYNKLDIFDDRLDTVEFKLNNLTKNLNMLLSLLQELLNKKNKKK